MYKFNNNTRQSIIIITVDAAKQVYVFAFQQTINHLFRTRNCNSSRRHCTNSLFAVLAI